MVLVELQNTCKEKLNRKRLDKLRVQGCQIWHSHVSIPFKSAPAHSTRPHNAKKALYVIISGKIPENWVHKSSMHMLFFDVYANFLSSHSSQVPARGIFGPKCHTSYAQMTENGRIWVKNGKKCTVENCGTTYLNPKSENNCNLFSSTFHVERPISRYGRLKLKLHL